jgi:ferredoxin-NADP reductase
VSAAPTPPLAWRAARVVETRAETPRVRTVELQVAGWPGHTAGQHVDVRLRAPDGYEARRSYSIASAPEQARTGRVAITVERLGDGEVSPYLVDELRADDVVQLRGPVGGHFTWRVEDGGPLMLVAGGSGVVPLMAMLRHRAAAASSVPARLLYSARTTADVIFRDELDALAAGAGGPTVSYAITREPDAARARHHRRIDAAMLAELAFPPAAAPRVFVCGPTALVEQVASALVSLGHAPARIRTERFGPSGG